MKKTIFIVLLNFASYLALFSQTNVSINLQRNSSITINGTTNLLPFSLTQSGEKLTNRNFTISALQSQNKIILSENEHSIEVRKFNSSNKMALRDFLKLVKSDTYPYIQIQLNYIENQQASISDDYLKGNASVSITITGIKKQYIIPISSNKSGDFFTFKGKKRLNIKDFGLIPPIEMLGLLRVNEWIDIDFNLICKITS